MQSSEMDEAEEGFLSGMFTFKYLQYVGKYG